MRPPSAPRTVFVRGHVRVDAFPRQSAGYITWRSCIHFHRHLTSLIAIMSYPTTHRSVTVIEAGKVKVQEKAVPAFDDEEILVRVRSVALNPVDWKVTRS